MPKINIKLIVITVVSKNQCMQIAKLMLTDKTVTAFYTVSLI